MKTFFKHEMKTRAQEKADRKRQTLSDRRKAYKAVELRDLMRCRCCGCHVSKTAHPSASSHLEHHHIEGRQVANAETTENICLLCKDCHDLRHVTRTLKIKGNANDLLDFEEDGRKWRG